MSEPRTGRKSKINPRWSCGSRKKYQARFRAMNAPCGICKGRLGPIHYDEPSDHLHPLSFVIDEIKPISKYKQFGYSSKEEAAADWNNLQAAHRICNAQKSDKTMENFKALQTRRELVNRSDGNW